MSGRKYAFLLGAVAFVAFCLGLLVSPLTNSLASGAVKAKADLSTFWDVWSLIETSSVQKDSLDHGKMVEGAIKGLVDSLDDPHTMFLNAEETKQDEESMSGKFDGIGATLEIQDKIPVIVSPLKNSPAEKAGLQAGDKILFIDKKRTTGMTMFAVVTAIKGKKGTSVTLTIQRNDIEATMDVVVVRDTIVIPLYIYEIKNNNIAYVQLNQFSQEAGQAMNDVAEDMAKRGIKKLVFDLRNNPGGYLTAAIEVTSYFLPEDELLLTSQCADNSVDSYHSLRIDGPTFRNITVVVLVNKGSASASEIVAGALQDHKKALIVGQQTYGKGSVQTIYGMRGNTQLRLTTAKWLTPSGNWISKKGITPDVITEMTKKDIKDKKDPQLDKALEILQSEK